MGNIQSGDTVTHPSLGETLLTVMEVFGVDAVCGYTLTNNRFIEERFRIVELTKKVDGQTDGKYN